MAGAIKLKEIATVTGVSMSTVSRAMSGDLRVNHKTRRRILAAVETLGDPETGRPPRAGRRSTPSIVLVRPEYKGAIGDTEISIAVLECLQDACEEIGWSALSGRLRMEKKAELVLGGVPREDVAGIIGYRMRDGDAEAVAALARADRLPLVMLNRIDQGNGSFCLSVDHRQAGRVAAQHMIGLGHRRIGAIFSRADVQSSRLRYEGICDELERSGAPLSLELQATDILDPGAACQAAASLVRRGATGLIIVSDRLAIEVQAHLHALAVKIPQDVSIISFDGTERGQFASPPLTSVYTPWREMTRAAARLIAMFDRDSLLLEGQLLWKPKLICGRSCAVAREEGPRRIGHSDV